MNNVNDIQELVTLFNQQHDLLKQNIELIPQKELRVRIMHHHVQSLKLMNRINDRAEESGIKTLMNEMKREGLL